MSDILMIPAPEYCTAQRFNLWMSMTIGTRAPLLGIALLSACKASPVNPFALGCIALHMSEQFADEEATKRNDFFGTGALYFSDLEACTFALQKAMTAGSLDTFPGMTPVDAAQVRGLYAQYVRFAKRMSGDREPLPPPAPLPVPAPPQNPPQTPVPPAPPANNSPSEPAPLPSPKPVPAQPKWKGTLKAAVAALGVVLGVAAWLIPDQFEVPIRAVLAMLKALIAD